MANRPFEWADSTGLVLYAFPASQSLGDWTTHRELLVERSAPNLGMYDATLDDAKGFVWYVFEGATQPASWADHVSEPINLPDTTNQGTGAYTITFTARDSDTSAPIAGALITVSVSGSIVAWGNTNASGVLALALNSGANAYTVKASGYSTLSSSVTVSANASVTASLSHQSPTPSDPGRVTGYWVVYDEQGNVEPNTRVNMQVVEVPATSTGLALIDTVRHADSNSSGVAEFANLFPGVTYVAYLQGSQKQTLVTVPANATSPVALGSIIG